MVAKKIAYGACSIAEFPIQVRAVGFLGSVRQLWKSFDDDNSGVIGMEELDAEAKAALDGFYEWANSKFGCTLQCWIVRAHYAI